MPFARVHGIQLYYERQGNGRPLLFIGGTGGDLREKPNVLQGPWVDAFDVLAYDQRNLGQSDQVDAVATMADYADDAAALLRGIGWESAAVVGVSFGGMVAQELVCRHPDVVETLVLCCTSPGGAGGSSYPLHELEGMDAKERIRLLLPILDTRRDAAWEADHPKAHDAIVRLMSERGQHGDERSRAGLLRQLEARQGHDCWDRLAGVRCPVLVCGGLYDGLARPEAQKALAERIPGARLEMFEGGHHFMVQDPRALSTIQAFIEES